MADLPQRFHEKYEVDPKTGCWLWTRGLGAGGYAAFWWNGRARGGHWVAYTEMVGPIPDGLDLDHFACDTRRCVNPAHVRPVTPRENALRGDTIAARHLAKTHCDNGHPFDAANTYMQPGVGRRQCRRCNLDAVRRYQAKRAS